MPKNENTVFGLSRNIRFLLQSSLTQTRLLARMIVRASLHSSYQGMVGNTKKTSQWLPLQRSPASESKSLIVSRRSDSLDSILSRGRLGIPIAVTIAGIKGAMCKIEKCDVFYYNRSENE